MMASCSARCGSINARSSRKARATSARCQMEESSVISTSGAGTPGPADGSSPALQVGQDGGQGKVQAGEGSSEPVERGRRRGERTGAGQSLEGFGSVVGF